MAEEDSRFRGKVVKEVVARGSKSEREAIQIVTDEGRYVLRRIGGNPFRDEELEALDGKTIEADGHLRGYTLLMSRWSEIEPEPEAAEESLEPERGGEGPSAEKD